MAAHLQGREPAAPWYRDLPPGDRGGILCPHPGGASGHRAAGTQEEPLLIGDGEAITAVVLEAAEHVTEPVGANVEDARDDLGQDEQRRFTAGAAELGDRRHAAHCNPSLGGEIGQLLGDIARLR